MRKNFFKIFLIVSGLLVVLGVAGIVEANHSWGGYHWSRGANPTNLTLADNVSSSWKSFLTTASSDWSASAILDTTVVPSGKDPRRCRPTLGRIDVCNTTYGNTGWLGVAQVWVNGDHIAQGTVKMNDTYFKKATYNTPAWKNLVMCQEIGHTFGLDHQDETFANANLGTCMDYTNDPSGLIYGQVSNEHPNVHDYDELAAIYAHLDGVVSSSTIKASNQNSADGVDMNDSREWGKIIRHDNHGKRSVHERDFGNGEKVFTFVVWAE